MHIKKVKNCCLLLKWKTSDKALMLLKTVKNMSDVSNIMFDE